MDTGNKVSDMTDEEWAESMAAFLVTMALDKLDSNASRMRVLRSVGGLLDVPMNDELIPERRVP